MSVAVNRGNERFVVFPLLNSTQILLNNILLLYLSLEILKYETLDRQDINGSGECVTKLLIIYTVT